MVVRIKLVLALIALNTLPACNSNLNKSAPPLQSFHGHQVNSPRLPQEHFIIGGEAVTTEDPLSRSTVAIYMPKPAPSAGISNFCTGTLITKKIILTAGHCFLDVSHYHARVPLEEFIPSLRIAFGVNVVKDENDQNVVFRKIARVIIHPDYRAGMVRRALKVPMPDVALILLNEEAPAFMQPVGMVMETSLVEKGRKVTLAGFGVTEPSLNALPKQLMKAVVTIDNPQLTSAQFSYRVNDGKSACFADSGGPAYATTENNENLVIGITSWGDPNCAKMGVYTSVPAFAPFINEAIGKLENGLE